MTRDDRAVTGAVLTEPISVVNEMLTSRAARAVETRVELDVRTVGHVTEISHSHLPRIRCQIDAGPRNGARSALSTLGALEPVIKNDVPLSAPRRLEDDDEMVLRRDPVQRHENERERLMLHLDSPTPAPVRPGHAPAFAP